MIIPKTKNEKSQKKQQACFLPFTENFQRINSTEENSWKCNKLLQQIEFLLLRKKKYYVLTHIQFVRYNISVKITTKQHKNNNKLTDVVNKFGGINHEISMTRKAQNYLQIICTEKLISHLQKQNFPRAIFQTYLYRKFFSNTFFAQAQKNMLLINKQKIQQYTFAGKNQSFHKLMLYILFFSRFQIIQLHHALYSYLTILQLYFFPAANFFKQAKFH
eukprot:TRINITY_DN16977_c0_g1_i11.p1 TRINITY_DN16977_c0_g1~~TRINITY_DN16977_c0_g1_i11.p1  ORF type:complete len:218 (+),score=4.50 TRINITY_DN16977_c0_g1_i11:256-909(+)